MRILHHLKTPHGEKYPEIWQSEIRMFTSTHLNLVWTHLVSRNAGDQKIFHPGGRKEIFFNKFSRIFSNSFSNFKTTVKSKFIAYSPVFLLLKRINVKCKPKSFTNSYIKPHLHMRLRLKRPYDLLLCKWEII